MMRGIIAILGSPNDDDGNLSDISIGRLAKGMEEYKRNSGYKIMCTGGFGEHFNRTDTPHAIYAVKYLKENGIPEEDILEIIESHDMIEDAVKSKPVIDRHGVTDLIVVSSDFHMERVKYVFRIVFKGYSLRFSGAETDFTEETYKCLFAHEKRELDKLNRQGIPGI